MDNDELLVVIKDMFESAANKLEKKFDEKIDNLDQKVNNLDQKINNIGIAVEALRSDVKAIAEGHSLLDARINRLEGNLNVKIDSVKDNLKAEIKIVQNYVVGVDEKLNEHDVILKRAK
jgi:chromosome segregation ATPase